MHHRSTRESNEYGLQTRFILGFGGILWTSSEWRNFRLILREKGRSAGPPKRNEHIEDYFRDGNHIGNRFQSKTI